MCILSGRSLGLSGEPGSTVSDRLQGESVNYVNIPVSPMSKRQLHYMELDLQDVQETGHTVRGEPSCLVLSLLWLGQYIINIVINYDTSNDNILVFLEAAEYMLKCCTESLQCCAEINKKSLIFYANLNIAIHIVF